MRIVLLIALTSLMPLVWGGAMYWLVARCWPSKEDNGCLAPADHPFPRYDYQI